MRIHEGKLATTNGNLKVTVFWHYGFDYTVMFETPANDTWEILMPGGPARGAMKGKVLANFIDRARRKMNTQLRLDGKQTF